MYMRSMGLRALAVTAIAAGVTAASGGLAWAADTVAPVVAPATFAAPPDGNNNWRITKPQTLTRDGDRRCGDRQVPVLAGRRRDVRRRDGHARSGGDGERAAVAGGQHDGAVIARWTAPATASRGATTNTTLNQASTVGATAVRLTSTTGRGAGDTLLIDTAAGQETATIATIVAGAPAAPAPNVTLTAPLANAHAANATVAGTATYNTIALLIDSKGPVATWGTAATTLQATSATAGAPANAPGDMQVRLASLDEPCPRARRCRSIRVPMRRP